MVFDKQALRNMSIGALWTIGWVVANVIIVIGLSQFFSLPMVLALIFGTIIVIALVCIILIPNREEVKLIDYYAQRCVRLKVLIQTLLVVTVFLVITIVVLINRLLALHQLC